MEGWRCVGIPGVHIGSLKTFACPGNGIRGLGFAEMMLRFYRDRKIISIIIH